MNNKVKLIIYIILFLLIIVIISLLYNKFLNNNKDEILASGNKIQTQQYNKDAAIDFTVYNENGEKVQLSNFKGKPILINFWTTWCGYCKQEMPDFNEIYKQEKDNVVFMMLNATDGIQETKEKASEYIKKEKYDFPVYYDTDEEAVYKYRINGFPTTIFIDKEFNISKIVSGMVSKSILLQNINKLKE